MKNLTFKAAMLKGSQPTVNRQSTDGQSQRHCKQTPLSKRWKVLMTLVFLFTFAIGNVMAEDFTITPINGSYYSPGNLAKVTLASNSSASSGRVDVKSSKTGGFTISTNAPGLYLKEVTFTDSQYSGNKKGTITCKSGGTLADNSGNYTLTPSANATSATIEVKASTSGDCKITNLSIKVTNGTTNNIETLSGFTKSGDDFSFSATCNGTSVTPSVGLSSSTWTVSGNNISAKSSNDSKTITVTSSNSIKYIAFYDSNCRMGIVEKSSTGGTVSGAAWTAPTEGSVKSVTFKNSIGSEMTITKVFVITEAAATHALSWNFAGGSTSSTTYTAAGQVAEGAPITYPEASTMSKEGKDFDGWSSSATTMPNSDLTITAQWVDHVAKYTVKYMDGSTVLDTEEVTVGQHPAGLASDPTKDCYTFAAWSPALNTVSGTDGQVVNVNATWTAQYTSGTYEFTGNLTMGTDPQMTIENNTSGKGYSAGRIDNIYVDAQTIGYEATGNYGGWKLKSQNKGMRFLVENASGIRVTLGEANPLRIDYTESGEEKSANITKSTTSSVYKADANTLVRLTNTTTGTVTLKKLEILPLYNATFTTAKSTVDPTSASNVTEVTLPTPTATTVGDYTFAGWKADKVVKDGDGDDQAIGTTLDAGKTYTLTATTIFTAQWTETSTIFAITKGTHANGDFTIDPASQQEAGEAVTLAATPNEDFVFSAWEVYKTGDQTTTVEVTSNAFTMPSYAVTVNAIFVADPRAKVLYVTSNTADATKANDKLYAALKDTYNVKIVGPTSDADQSAYALVVLHESVGGSDYGATAVAAAKTGNTPVLNTKSYFYNDGRWDWGAPNAGKSVKGATLNSEYCNIASHPLFAGVTITDGFFDITAEPANKCMQPVGSFTSGKEGYTLATTPNNDSGNGCAIHELTPAQRGANAGKYLMISVSNGKLNALNANGQKLFQNAAAYLIGNTAWEPEGPKTVTHTLTGVTTSSDDEVCAGVAYAATYEAAEGYSLPASVTVKAGSTDITSNCTWTQATGVLAIPADQVTDNIEIVVNGVFNCPVAGSGDVLFSWTPKDEMADKDDIAAGTYDLPGDYLTSIVGGSALMYLPGDNKICIRNSRLAYNGDYAYVKLTVCALKEGDKFEITSPAAANNIWVSTSATRPADAEAAAAVIEQGTAYYIPSTSALIDATEIYLWRAGSLTELGTITITRSKKFTVTYEASDLTEGAAPAAVDAFDGQKIIVAGQGTMVKGVDHFAGWKDAGDNEYAENDELTVTANMTLTAQWTACAPLTLAMSGYETTLTAGGATTTVTLDKGASTGTVTWESSDETILSVENGVITPLKGGTATVTAHVAEDATYCANDITSDEITVNCVVTYDANGGEGTMADATGTTVTIAANGFTYDSHKFLRWNTQPDGLGDDVAVGATVNENKTLYAIWKEVTCTAGANIFSIEFTNDEAVKMSYNDPELDLASNATIVGGNAYMKYFNGTNTNQTVVNTNHQVVYGTNNMYLKLDLDCELQAGDVISFEDFSGSNQLTIAVDLTSGAPKDAAKKVSATGTGTTRTYTVEANDALEGESVLFIGRPASGSLYHKVVTVYRPLPDAPVPTIDNTTPADASYTGAASPMTVAAEVTGAEDLHYQWYKEAGETDIEVGTDAASYTPTASGEYYCVVTNSPTGYTPKSATSRTATITMISSDATLAWLKADGNDIALSDGEYAYEYVIADAATVAPTITAGKNEEHASVTITQADSKTGTATVHVVAEDGETSHDYTVKFNEFSGCLTTFYFSYADDADENHVTNNAQLRGHTVFTDLQSNGSSYGGTLTVNDVDYTATKSTSSKSSFGKLVVPAKYSATLYLLVRIGSSNTSLQLVKEGESTPYMSSDVYAEEGTYQYNFENVQAGTYVIRAWRNGSVQNCNYIAMAAELCRYEVSSVSLANMTLRTGNTATPEMTITPAKGSVVSQAWSFVDAATAAAAGLSINATTGAITATDEATPGNYNVKVVLNGDNALSATCTVTVITEYSQVSIDNSIVWNFANALINNTNAALVSTEELLLANVENVVNNPVTFNSQALVVKGIRVDEDGYTQASTIKFITEVPGFVNVEFSNTGNAPRPDRYLLVNGERTTYKSGNQTHVNAKGIYVPAGEVVISSEIYDNEEYTASTLNIFKVEFTKGQNMRTLTPGRMGTFTTAYNVKMFHGADFFVPNQTYSLGIEFISVDELKAGYPYFFVANDNALLVVNEGDAATEAAADHSADGTRGMVGYLGTDPVRVDVPNGDDYAVVKNNHLYTAYNNTMTAGYAYFDMTIIRTLESLEANNTSGAPRRRMTVGYEAPAVVTDIDNLSESEQPMKVMIDGQLFIIRGEKMFDATGRLVK